MASLGRVFGGRNGASPGLGPGRPGASGEVLLPTDRENERYFSLVATILPPGYPSIQPIFARYQTAGPIDKHPTAGLAVTVIAQAADIGSSPPTRTHLPPRFQTAGFPGQRLTAYRPVSLKRKS